MAYNEEMIKSLTSLIDETLEEIEEIKKSKFAAQEISLGDGDSGVSGKSKNGEMEAKKKEDDDEDEDCEKGENEKADEDHGSFKVAESVGKGENEKADEDHGSFKVAESVGKGEDCEKAEDEEDEEDEEDDKKKMKKMDYKMKKSIEESEELVKSYIDDRFEEMQDQLSKMVAVIESIADQPVERRGVPAGVAPLAKSADEVEPLSKSEVATKLFDLKKSGQQVDSMDIFKVETGNDNTVLEIANKYGLR